MKETNATKKIVMAAMFAALVCVATMIIKIPSPLKGYINLGDCAVLLCGWMLSPLYGFLAAGLGSALADLLSGYNVYIPATFVIKGLMAVTAYYGFKWMHKSLGNMPSRIISGITSEAVMVLGYYVFEGFLYDFGASLINLPANGIQAAAGIILGCLLIKIFQKIKL